MFRHILEENYIITNDIEDSVETKEILHTLQENNIRFSKQKIGRMLSKIIKSTKKDKVVNGKRMRLGIKRRNDIFAL